MHCSAEGEWLVPIGKCICKAGYQQKGDTCEPCGRRFYKSSSQDLQCSRCPTHSFSDREGSSRCECEDGYYRAPSDPPYVACTRPPSAPQNLIFNINQTTVSLEWSPPADNGGRNDVTYRILCKRCSWEQGECVPCGSNIGYMPQQTGLEDNYVTVMDLLAHANYTFEVEAVNGVSDLSRSQRLFAAVSITTGQADLGIMQYFTSLLSSLQKRGELLGNKSEDGKTGWLFESALNPWQDFKGGFGCCAEVKAMLSVHWRG